MAWLDHHKNSEQLAAEAEVLARSGDWDPARRFYAEAAAAEERALDSLDGDRWRTYGITAVSAVSLYYKSAQWDDARFLAHRCLGVRHLPDFASRQLEDLLVSIQWGRDDPGIGDGRILVSIKGGEIRHGGAPMDLVLEKAQRVRSLLYRTVEFVRELPHRREAEPGGDIRGLYRPWLFQSAPGSYQFAVALQEVRQLELFRPGGDDLVHRGDVSPELVVDRLLGILKACVESPDLRLQEVVSDSSYRSTFLKLTRDLAPTGRGRFTQLDIHSVGGDVPLVLVPAVRSAINDAIRRINVDAADPMDSGVPEEELRGVLRAVHLDRDWIEVMVDGRNVRVERMGEEVDDRIGPMVNQPVVVRVVRVGQALHFRDVELDD